MTASKSLHPYVASLLLIFFCMEPAFALSPNISCYQCVQYTNKECGPEDIKPCPSSSDRCVTHISKDKQHGYSVKRECGLGPCDFDDPNINRGLGWNICDRSKEEYFCIICCKDNACNKSAAERIETSLTIAFVVLSLLFIKIN